MSITSITVYGEQIVDYIWIKNGTLSEDELNTYLDVYTPENALPQDLDTIFFAKYDNSLSAGTYETDETIVGWDVYKRKENATQLEFVTTIDIATEFIVDHLIENDTEYVYYVFPRGLSTMGSPVISDTVASKVWNWILFTATESATDKNVLIASHAYVFQGNVSSGSMSNNSESTVLNNFTKYPKVIKGTANYKSGTLKALIGLIDYANNRYVEKEGLRDALFALTTSNDRMFLKNRAGDIWEVSIHNAMTMETADTSPFQPNMASIPWTEINNVSDISLISMEELPDE